MDVSRETSPETEPDFAGRIFGERIDVARAFVANLAREGELRGLIGPQETSRIWSRHILNSAVVAPLFAGSVADVGSGAGLPGLVCAIASPDVEWTLIEPMARRVTWLEEQIAELSLGNVTVVRTRSEDWARGPVFDAVTARAVAGLRSLVPLTAPLVRDGGELILLKGAHIDAEITKAAKQIRAAKMSDIRVEVVGAQILAEPTRLLRARVRA